MEKYFGEFKNLFKTQKALKHFLETEDLERWHEIMKYYRPKAAARRRGSRKATISWLLVADAVFSEYIRIGYADEKGKSICKTCGNSMSRWDNQAGHFKTRDFRRFRYDVRNVHPQCYACNVAQGGRERDQSKYVEARYGADVEEMLWTNKQTYKIRDYIDLVKIRADSVEMFKATLEKGEAPIKLWKDSGDKTEEPEFYFTFI